MSEYQEIVEREWEKYSKSQHLPNIMLLGCTGCGKSTLINTIFGNRLLPVGWEAIPSPNTRWKAVRKQ